MRPITLTMKAFGSFANEVTVEFDKLKSGLFLITGDTGAGKTTIFDAMVFALYGVASGSGRSDDAYMMHSDYVSKGEDTVVKLVFEHLGKKYEVERKIHFSKNQDGSGFGSGTTNAELKEEGKGATKNSGKVTARITEIIGLDKDQFRQIIVLAQGEFQKFLSAKSDEKNHILGRLFDSTPYIRFQNRLKTAANNVNNIVKEEKKAIEMKIGEFCMPEEENAKILYSISNPDCVLNIEKLIEKEKAELAEMDDAGKGLLEAKDEISARRGKAEDRNKALDLLVSYEAENRGLQEQKNEMAELGEKLERVETANTYITPLVNARNAADRRLSETDISLGHKNAELKAASERKAAADKAFETVSSLEERNTSLNTELSELNKQLNNFAPFNKAKNEVKDYSRRVDRTGGEIEGLQKERESLVENKKAAEEKIQSLKADAEAYGAREAEYNAAKVKLEQLIGVNGLIEKMRQVSDEEENLKKSRVRELELLENVKAEKSAYDVVYDGFLKSQASILAKELQVELETKEEVLCPVCHNHILKADAASLSVNEDEIVTKSQVEKAENAHKDAENSHHEAHTAAEKQKSFVKSLKERAVEFAVHQMGLEVEGFDDITDDYLTDLEDNLLSDKNSKQILFKDSEAAKNEREKKEAYLCNITSSIEKNAEELKNKQDEKAELDKKLAGAEAALKNLEDTLKGLSEEETTGRIKAVSGEINANRDEINKRKKDKASADSEVNSLSGTVDTLKESKASIEAELESGKETLSSALVKYGFADEAAYAEIIKNCGPDVDRWIRTIRAAVTEFNEKVNTAGRLLEKQQDICKDYEREDLSKIDEELNEVTVKFNELERLKKQKNSMCGNHESVLSFIKNKYASIGKYLPVSERLSKLADLANGTNNADGGKITFDRYVMGAAFAEILEAANVHLNIMSSGQYELVHQTKSAAKNAAAGLDIEVNDVFTQEQRKPDSLSGGEKFQVSMSLALGLSDVVQNHAGGKKIDTMYIDEGFGTLDEAVLGKALEVLKTIAGDTRQVGIISHVDRLGESITQKIQVKKGKNGSTLTMKEE